MSKLFLLDSNLLIDFFRGKKAAINLLDESMNNIAISVITVTELIAGARVNEKQQVLGALKALKIIPINFDIALLAGEFRNKYLKSHQLDSIDAVIAATAEVTGATLLTLNTKHFPMFKNLKRPY